MATIKPTIGRKVWYWCPATSGIGGVLDTTQAFDATIIFVHSEKLVNLIVTDHEGETSCEQNVELLDPGMSDHHGGDTYATWMPFQVGQAKAAKPENAEPNALELGAAARAAGPAEKY